MTIFAHKSLPITLATSQDRIIKRNPESKDMNMFSILSSVAKLTLRMAAPINTQQQMTVSGDLTQHQVSPS